MQKTRFPAVIATFIACYAFWVLITWSFTVQELAAGAVVSLAVALFSARLFIHEKAFWLFNPVKLFGVLIYVPVFLRELVKSNWDVAKRVFGGCRNVNPGIVKVPVSLESEYGQSMLANAITLTPGTITVDVQDDVMLVHCIDRSFGEGLDDSEMEKRILRIEGEGRHEA